MTWARRAGPSAPGTLTGGAAAAAERGRAGACGGGCGKGWPPHTYILCVQSCALDGFHAVLWGRCSIQDFHAPIQRLTRASTAAAKRTRRPTIAAFAAILPLMTARSSDLLLLRPALGDKPLILC